jgi:hypothetical protein
MFAYLRTITFKEVAPKHNLWHYYFQSLHCLVEKGEGTLAEERKPANMPSSSQVQILKYP